MPTTRTRLRLAALVSILAGAACAHPVPGWGPPLVAEKQLVPESTCNHWREREVAKGKVGERIVGAADFHFHQFANRGFGGRLLWGEPFDKNGIEAALPACGSEDLCLDDREAALVCAACFLSADPETCRADCMAKSCATPLPHGHFGDTDPIGAVLGQGYGHLVGGYPRFIGWPNYNTHTHQQAYHRWLRRAFDGGLKLVVMQAVSNAALCEVLGGDHSCNDMDNVDLQIAGAKELEEFVDEQNDCRKNGNGWYRIAKSPSEARQIIADGKMAVVLGIEVDTLFNCFQRGGCTLETVKRDIAKYYGLGVRHVFPVHVLDNGFGGAAAYNDFFNFGNVWVNGSLFDVKECSSDYEFKFGDAPNEVNGFIKYMASKLNIPYDDYKSLHTHCNKRGLNPERNLGRDAILALMDAKMLIDVDHMSAAMRKEVLTLAEAKRYPGIVSGHSGFTELVRGNKKSEGELTADEVRRIVTLGGRVAPILNQASRDESLTHASSARRISGVNDCGHSVKSFAASYLYAVEHASGSGVGFGSDMNGLAGLPTPRFGPYRCGGDGVAQANPVVYPIALYPGMGPPMERSQAGNRVFDINVDGYAHAGMFPDFVAELRAIGLTDKDLEPLFDSAEAYISMWECAEEPNGTACASSKPRQMNGRRP